MLTDYTSELESSPLYRTILVKPMPRASIVKSLRPFRSYLQTAGLACHPDEVACVTRLLIRAGVTRVTSAGQMESGYHGQPHDGVYALSRYVRRVSAENSAFPATAMEFAEMMRGAKQPFAPGTPVMKKADFNPVHPCKDDARIVLKSGGSSGKAVYAPHTYEDAYMTYITAARALIAAGMDTHTDVCMNLFYCGDMYGGFISMYEGLKLAEVTQLPMAACMDMDFVAEEIVTNKATALIGMPTYLIRLFSEKCDALKAYGGIKKVFYAGEHFDPKLIEKLKRDFNIDIIGSIVYGCNELGTIGYTCPHCLGTEHHLISSKYMEILKLDSDEPAPVGEVGRIVLTPVDRENISVNRYEIGDLGRFITEPCACGRVAPKFELLGRFGDVFKFATNYVNAGKIKRLFSEQLGYMGRMQIELSYDGISKMNIKVTEDLPAAVDMLREHYPEIEECLRDKTGDVTCTRTNSDDFVISTGGGKVRLVVDRRI